MTLKRLSYFIGNGVYTKQLETKAEQGHWPQYVVQIVHIFDINKHNGMPSGVDF